MAKAIFIVDPDSGELDIGLVNQLVMKLFQKVSNQYKLMLAP